MISARLHHMCLNIQLISQLQDILSTIHRLEILDTHCNHRYQNNHRLLLHRPTRRHFTNRTSRTTTLIRRTLRTGHEKYSRPVIMLKNGRPRGNKNYSLPIRKLIKVVEGSSFLSQELIKMGICKASGLVKLNFKNQMMGAQ